MADPPGVHEEAHRAAGGRARPREGTPGGSAAGRMPPDRTAGTGRVLPGRRRSAAPEVSAPPRLELDIKERHPPAETDPPPYEPVVEIGVLAADHGLEPVP